MNSESVSMRPIMIHDEYHEWGLAGASMGAVAESGGYTSGFTMCFALPFRNP